tara:strand:- start:55 stop:507 length:453 start_codon:yes stop_codon:yes gene_type:complete
MKKILSVATLLLTASFPLFATESLIKYESQYSVKETADRFESIAKSKGLTVFARIDHQKNAGSVDLTLRPTEVIIFGNPKVGTPLMQCAQSVAIDLPQKILVSEDAEHKVWLTYNNPEYLKERHEMTGCDEVIKKVSGVLSNLSKAAIAK